VAILHAQSGEVVDVRPLGSELPNATTRALIMNKHFEVIRMILPAGKEIPEHQAKGEIIVHCLEGLIHFNTSEEEVKLGGGQLLHLNAGEPHALRAVEDSSVLLTIVFAKDRISD
jgi:quercetin dioxygenase-like cupin family protein